MNVLLSTGFYVLQLKPYVSFTTPPSEVKPLTATDILEVVNHTSA